MSSTVHLALTLHPACRTSEGVARACAAAAALGLEVTASGRATVSVRADVATFARLFGFDPLAVPATPPGERDFGAPAGHAADRELAVPETLAPYVEVVAVMPPARRLGG